MNGEHIEYLQICYMADKQFNEYFDNYLFYKNVREVIKLDINTHHNDEYNKISMLHHIYFYKKLRLIYDQFGDYIFNNYDYSIILNNLNDLNEYIGEEDYEIIIKMYLDVFEFKVEKARIKRKYNIRNIMLKSKWLCINLINNILEYL